MHLSVVRRILVVLAVAALASALFLPDDAWDWIFGETMIFKALIALRIVLVGLSAVFTAIWYLLFSLPDRKQSSPVDSEV
jgi:hypothetical protein